MLALLVMAWVAGAPGQLPAPHLPDPIAAVAPSAPAEYTSANPALATTTRLWRATLRFPRFVARDWKQTLPIGLGTAALITLADRPAAGEIHNPDLEADSAHLSDIGLVVLEPAVLVGATLAISRCLACSPTLRTLESGAATVLYATAVVQGLKIVARRQRPNAAEPNGEFFEGGSSFPSGHAMASFTMASFLAHRYPRHRWIPWVAYSLAGAVSLLRFTGKRHYPSDLFFGGALGYALGRCAVTCG